MEIKIVINFKDDKAVVGVMAPSCDPVMKTYTGDLPTIFGYTSGLVEEARAKWVTSPKNPTIDLPKPAVKEAPASSSKAKPVPAATQATKTQPAMF